MNRIMDNIRYLSKEKGIRICDLEEKDYYVGKFSQLMRNNRMEQIPLDLIYYSAKQLGVTIEDLVEKDFKREAVLEKVRRQIEELEAEERRLLAEREGGMDVNY